jgi:hypothetical protein
MPEKPGVIPAYERPRFVAAIYRLSFVIGAAAAGLAAAVEWMAGLSVAVGGVLAVGSFWALERTLASTYARSSGGADWGGVALALAKYALIAVTLLVASRVDAISMGFLATGLAVVYAAVVVAATRDMIRRRAAERRPAGSKDLV